MDHKSGREGPAGRRGERGATLVEYALVVALVVVGSIGAISQLTDSAESETENHARCMETRPPPEECQQAALLPPSDDMGGGNGGDDDDNGDSPPPTDPPPTTEPPEPEVLDLAWTGTSVATENGNWTAIAELTLLDEDGDPVEGALIQVIFRITDPDVGQGFAASCTTNAAGECTLEWNTPAPDIEEVTLEIANISAGLNTEVPEPQPIVFQRPGED